MGDTLTIGVPDVENKKILNPILHFLQALQNYSRIYQWTNHYKLLFQYRFEI